jgi:ABC-2 type transport system permease protein
VKLRPYLAYFSSGLSARRAYMGSAVLSLLSATVTFAITIMVWRFTTGGPSQQPQLFAYLTLAFCANVTLGSTLENQIGERIREGYVAMDLLKPINFAGLYLAKSLSDYLFQGCIALAAFLVALCFLGSSLAPASPAAAAVSLLSLALGGLVQFQFCFLLMQAVFVTTSNYGVGMTRISLHQVMSGVFAPLALYPPSLQAWARALPFHHIVYTPSAIWLGMIPLDQAPTALLHQVYWIVGLGVAGQWVFSRVLNHLTVQGG